jgi:hypothetical protein
MGVAQPVRRHRCWQPGPLCCGLDDTVHLRRIQPAALPRTEHRRVGILGPQGDQLLPDRRPQQHGAGFAALAEQGDLVGIVARGDVAAAQPVQLADAQAAEVEQPQQRLVPSISFERQPSLALEMALGKERDGRYRASVRAAPFGLRSPPSLHRARQWEPSGSVCVSATRPA